MSKNVIELSKLKVALSEVLDEELDQSKKEREELVECITDRLQQDFEIVDDESEDEEDEEETEEVTFED
jgi:hypothetical protein